MQGVAFADARSERRVWQEGSYNMTHDGQQRRVVRHSYTIPPDHLLTVPRSSHVLPPMDWSPKDLGRHTPRHPGGHADLVDEAGLDPAQHRYVTAKTAERVGLTTDGHH